MQYHWIDTTGTKDVKSLPHEGKSFLMADHTNVGRALADALRETGGEVMLCHKGTQALDSVRMRPWDVLLVGFRLIDMRGDAIAHAACAERPELAGRIVILTDESIGREAAEAANFTWLQRRAPVDAVVAYAAMLANR